MTVLRYRTILLAGYVTDMNVYFLLANAYEDAQMMPEAEKLHRFIVEQNPRFWLAYRDLRSIMHDEGRRQ